MKVLLPILFLLAGCTADPLRRHQDEFPPKHQTGDRITRRGLILHNGGIAYQFDF